MSLEWVNLPVGAGVTVLLIREVSRFIRERQGDTVRNGKSGDKSADFWESKMREIVYTELERHVLPRLREIEDTLQAVHNTAQELRWRHNTGGHQ